MPDIRFDDYYAIIPHPTTSSIFLLKSEDGWTLPKATVPLSPNDGRWRDAFRINTAFYQLLEHLQRIVPRLKSACVELAHLGIPASVHHGDFHRGNIIVHETGCTLIDWAGFMGVTHPFLSLWVPLSDWEEAERKILLESYLEVWSDYASLEQLRSTLALAYPLAALCGALGHRHQIYHAHTNLAWDILGEQHHLLDCLRSIIKFI